MLLLFHESMLQPVLERINLAELTSNGVHEGSNRYEIGNGALKTNKIFN